MARSQAGQKKVHVGEEDLEVCLVHQDGGRRPVVAAVGSSSIAGSQWLVVVVLSAVVAIICSIDRAAMSVAILPMSKQFAWRPTVMGAVSGAFNVGYMLTNFLGGYLAGRHGAERTLAAGVVVWSLFTMLTPLAAATRNLPLLLLVRALMGVGEGVAFPCMQYLVKHWVPADRRTRALGCIYSGHQIGSVLSLLLSPSLIESRMGWPAVFYAYGALGFGWLMLWQPLVVGAAAAAEKQLAGGQKLECSGGKPLQEPGRLPWRRAAANKVVWALFVAHINMGVCYNMAMSWLPMYFAKQFDVNVRESSALSILPWLVMALSTNLAGWSADALINAKMLSTTKTRKLMQLIGTIGPAICLSYLSATSNIASKQQHGSAARRHEAMWLMTGMMGTLGIQGGGFAATHQDIAPSHIAASLFGVTNAACSLAGTLSVYATGVLLERAGSWALVFRAVAWCNVACAAHFALASSSMPQFQ